MTYCFLTRRHSTKESALRRRAQRMGYRISKSRDKSTHFNNTGEFRLCDDRNTVLLGDRFDASLADIDSYLAVVVHMEGLSPHGSA
jgi:hypothetical protein